MSCLVAVNIPDGGHWIGRFVGDYEELTNVGNDLVPVFVQVNNGDTANRTDVIETTVGP